MPAWEYHGSDSDVKPQHSSNRWGLAYNKFAEGTQMFLQQPNKGLKMNWCWENPRNHFPTDDADIQIKTERKWSDFDFYRSQLTLHNVSMDSNYGTRHSGADSTGTGQWATHCLKWFHSQLKVSLKSNVSIAFQHHSIIKLNSFDGNQQRTSVEFYCTKKRIRTEFDLLQIDAICSCSMARGESLLLFSGISFHLINFKNWSNV